jgi:hypothetical protein
MGPRSGSSRDEASAASTTDETGTPITLVVLGGTRTEPEEPDPPPTDATLVSVTHGPAIDWTRWGVSRLVGAAAAALLVVAVVAVAVTGMGSGGSSPQLGTEPDPDRSETRPADPADQLLAGATDPAQDETVALLLAAEAWRRDSSTASRDALIDVVGRADPDTLDGERNDRHLPPGVTDPIASADGRWMLVRRSDGTVERRSTTDPGRSGTPLPDLGGPGGSFPVAIAADGSRALVRGSGEEGRLSVVVVDTAGPPIVRWEDTEGRFAQEAGFATDGRSLVVFGRDRAEVVRVDLDSGRPTAWQLVEHLLPGSPEPVGHPRFSDDGRFVDITLDDRIARLESDDLQVASQAEVSLPLTTDSVSVPGTWSVVVAGQGGRLERWNLLTGEVEAWGRAAHGEPVADLVLGGGGDVVVALTAGGGAIGLFDAESLRPLGAPLEGVNTTTDSLALSPDGHHVLARDANGSFRSWPVTGDAWFEAACAAAGRDLSEAEWTTHVSDTEPHRPTCSG